MTIDDFINTWTNKAIDFDGIYPNQCMDLMHFYVYQVLNIIDKAVLAKPWAALVYTQFAWGNLFTKIDNSPTNFPQKGDIIFWSEKLNFDSSVNHGYGHVAIVVSADAKSFTSFDANWPLGHLPQLVKHNYVNVLGWLRHIEPAPQAPVVQPAPVDMSQYVPLTQYQIDLGSKQVEITQLTTQRDEQAAQASIYLNQSKTLSTTVNDLTDKLTQLQGEYTAKTDDYNKASTHAADLANKLEECQKGTGILLSQASLTMITNELVSRARVFFKV